MARDVRQIRIESILGGQSPTTHFAGEDQFRASLGINPALPISDSSSSEFGVVASGLLRPSGTLSLSSSLPREVTHWIVPTPKTQTFFLYDARGSAYTEVGGSFTELGDAGELSGSTGNGCAYYDNYIYFAKNTTVARYGPLDGTPGFNGNYWVGTLGKAELTNPEYPFNSVGILPNHVMHRHSDGRLYFGDVVDNRGTIHYIQTTKTAVEGDTDAGSTYDALDFGYGLYPTAIETYGEYLAIALHEGGIANNAENRTTAKLAFWDTTSANVNSIIWVEFPDDVITALKNVNGILYIASKTKGGSGFRVSRYIGGNTIEDVAYNELGISPFPGAMAGTADRLLFGSRTSTPEQAPVVFSLGLQKSSLGNGMFVPYRGSGNTSTMVTALSIDSGENFFSYGVLAAWSNGTAGGSPNNGLDRFGIGSYATANQVWWSQLYRIGQPFKITKIRIPLAQAVAANMILTPTIYVDDGTSTYVGGSTGGLSVINNTNYSGKKNIVFRPENLTGEHNFWLGLKWTGSALCTVGLPITIEYELIDD